MHCLFYAVEQKVRMEGLAKGPLYPNIIIFLGPNISITKNAPLFCPKGLKTGTYVSKMSKVPSCQFYSIRKGIPSRA